ncbi:MAG: AmmeMemoRadiSam system protein B [Deltaproteobacteria bacterium]|nr:AmmeMemoRadiSam system protein B [Deltaproteobacteria bacterium]
MKTSTFLCFFLLSFLFLPFPGDPAHGGPEKPSGEGVRDPILAGSWYPAGAKELSAQIGAFLARAEGKALRGDLKAIIVPHAGITYSGQVAAYAYRLLEGRGFERVVLVGPSHRLPFRGSSVNLQSAYRTPLGEVPVDREFAGELMKACPDLTWVPRAHELEHCLEIQIPFLQSVLGQFRIVPILMGEQDPGSCSRLARALVQGLWGSGGTLLLASTDLSHFHSAERARQLDLEFIRQIRNFDPEGLIRSLRKGDCEACGGGPAAAVMLAAAHLGADRARILSYAHSGDVTGDNTRVVGYLSAALLKGERESTGDKTGD